MVRVIEGAPEITVLEWVDRRIEGMTLRGRTSLPSSGLSVVAEPVPSDPTESLPSFSWSDIIFVRSCLSVEYFPSRNPQ